MKRTFAIASLILAVAVLGSFQPSIKAEDVDTLYNAPQGSFAEIAPLIPGYNAPYPFPLASQAAEKAPTAAEAMSPSSYGSAVGFATGVPRIPGYNAAYPALSLVVTQN